MAVELDFVVRVKAAVRMLSWEANSMAVLRQLPEYKGGALIS